MRTNNQDPIIATISALARVARRSADRSMAELGLSGAQGFVLMHIFFRGDVCQKDIERHFMMSRATVSNLMDSLEGMGLISRSTDAVDRRRRSLTLTDKGRKMVESSIKCLDSIDEMMRSSLPDGGKVFLDSCHRLIDVLEEALC